MDPLSHHHPWLEVHELLTSPHDSRPQHRHRIFRRTKVNIVNHDDCCFATFLSGVSIQYYSYLQLILISQISNQAMPQLHPLVRHFDVLSSPGRLALRRHLRLETDIFPGEGFEDLSGSDLMGRSPENP